MYKWAPDICMAAIPCRRSKQWNGVVCVKLIELWLEFESARQNRYIYTTLYSSDVCIAHFNMATGLYCTRRIYMCRRTPYSFVPSFAV